MVNPYESYLKTGLETMPLPKVIANGYERIVLELKSAIESIKTGDIKSKISHIHRALEILRVLRLGLDFEKGGEIAVNLDNIYEFLERHISLGNLKNDEKILNEAIEILNTVKSGWDEIA
ncbi:MAG: flagellar export chaperone FliS [Hydrogenothermaceae bacterium]